MRRPVWSFPSLLVSLPPLPSFVLASFSRLHRFRGRRPPGRGLPGRGQRHWVASLPLLGRPSHLSLVGESRPHARPLYRLRLAPPLRRLLFRLGEARPSLPKITVARLPPRRVFPRWARTSRFHSQRPRQLISRPLRQLTPSPSWGPPASALRLAGGPVIGSRHLPSPSPSSRVLQPPAGRPRIPWVIPSGSIRRRPRRRRGGGAVAGVAGTVAAPAAVTPGVEPLGRPLDPAVVPAAGAEVVAWVAEPVAASVAAPPGVEPQRRPPDPAAAPAVGAEVVVVGAGMVAVPAAAAPGAGPRGRSPAPAVVPAAVPRVGRQPHPRGGA